MLCGVEVGERPPDLRRAPRFPVHGAGLAVPLEIMPIGDHTTKTAVTTPTVLAIGCPPSLVSRCAAALSSTGALMRSCDMAGAATDVAQRRPLAIVIPQDVYAFDPAELDALARDVGASLLRVEPDITAAMLELLLGAAIDTALARRRKQGAVIVGPGDPRATPSSGRQTVPHRRISVMDLEPPPSSERAG